MKKIATAIVALIRAIPGEPSISATSNSIAFNFNTDDDQARAFAAQFGIKELTWASNEENRWLRGSTYLDGLYISVFGPMHPIAAVEPVDRAKVEAALAQAAAATEVAS